MLDASDELFAALAEFRNSKQSNNQRNRNTDRSSDSISQKPMTSRDDARNQFDLPRSVGSPTQQCDFDGRGDATHRRLAIHKINENSSDHPDRHSENFEYDNLYRDSSQRTEVRGKKRRNDKIHSRTDANQAEYRQSVDEDYYHNQNFDPDFDYNRSNNEPRREDCEQFGNKRCNSRAGGKDNYNCTTFGEGGKDLHNRSRDRGGNDRHNRGRSQDGRYSNVLSDSNKNDGRQRNVMSFASQQAISIKPMGFKRLEELSDQEPADVVKVLANKRSGFEDLLKIEIRPDFMILVLKAVSKVCICDFNAMKLELLTQVVAPAFLEQLSRFLGKMPSDSCIENPKRMQLLPKFCEHLAMLYETVINLMPSTAAERLPSIVIATSVAMRGTQEFQKVKFNDALIEKMKNLHNQLMKPKETKTGKTNVSEQIVYGEPPNDIRDISIYPTVEDVLLDDVFLRPNIVKGPYANVQHYLDVQFRLMREDFVSPLRTGIKEYMLGQALPAKKHEKKRITSIRMYPHARFLSTKVIKDKVGYVLRFGVKNRFRHVNWEYSKRLIFGSLMLFTNNNFDSFFLATVLERSSAGLKDCLVVVEPTVSAEVPYYLFDIDWLMAESEVYFEPYFCVLSALQKMEPHRFPLEKYIIYVQPETDMPSYIQNGQTIYNIDKHKFNILLNDAWPSNKELNLNPSQYTAFKAALTNELAVIQGPPGTGKTYLALMIGRVLVNNIDVWNNPRTPILVVCYTNHALDQFLEGLIPVTKKIIRIGGQSKNEALIPFSLREKRKNYTVNQQIYRLLRSLSVGVKQSVDKMKALQYMLENIEKCAGIIALSSLQSFISRDQLNDLNSDKEFVIWLLEGSQNVTNTNVAMKESVTSSTPSSVTAETQDGDSLDGDDENARRQNEIDDDFGIDMDLGIEASHPGLDQPNLLYAAKLEAMKNEYQSLNSEITSLQERMANEKHNRYEIGKLLEDREMDALELHQQTIYLEGQLEPQSDPTLDKQLDHLRRTRSVWQMPFDQRWILYRFWKSQLRSRLQQDLKKNEQKYRVLQQQCLEARQLVDIEMIKGADIVGITTTGAAKFQAMIKGIKSKIAIVEEAAEVMEAHIVTSLTNYVQHLILIGDHEQLRPSPAVFKLARKYHLDVSMFERMLNNGIACHMLDVQHRMRPEIARLIVPAVYARLEDHESVCVYPPVRGITKNVFFVDHTELEDAVPDTQSSRNIHEAEFLLALCRHLILQGYDASEITILATYSGQMLYMRKKRKEEYGILHGVRITVVDNYQGEENTLVLLSLVRSNKEGKIGFLKTKNRVCVALSRAKHGLYIIGNMAQLREGGPDIWPHVCDQLLEQEAIGSKLTLRCEVHNDVLTHVKCADDFKHVPEGGCTRTCGLLMHCGHSCKSVCHVIDREHLEYQCYENCPRVICTEAGHVCPLRCRDPCKPCIVPMERQLECGHIATLVCNMDPGQYLCLQPEEFEMAECSHRVMKPCSVDSSKFACTKPCENRLLCGHACTRNCHVLDDPDHLETRCQNDCTRINKDCRKSHPCNKRCHEECGKCTILEQKKLPCGHSAKLKCCVDPAQHECRKRCKKTMACGHECKRECYFPCDNCQELVVKDAPCGHPQKVKCSQKATSDRCYKPCEKLLRCGHKCKYACCNPCEVNCRELVERAQKAACGHRAFVMCYMSTNDLLDITDEVLKFCKAPCREILGCGHVCQGTCGECMQGRIHKVCGSKCDNVLVCGHTCDSPCRNVCPPCNKRCTCRCVHNICNKKCGEPCDPCKERCKWQCEHLKCSRRCGELCDRPPCNQPCPRKLPKCNHDCAGFCGEPCPKLCRICDHEELTTILFGNEDEPDARFVVLVDCGHTIESHGLEEWLKVEETGTKEIQMKVCPRCKMPISKTLRYGNLIKTVFKDIQEVKRKLFGDPVEINRRRMVLLNKLPSFDALPKDSLETCGTIKDKVIAALNPVTCGRRNPISHSHLAVMEFTIDYLTGLADRVRNDWPNIGECVSKENLVHRFNLLVSKLAERSLKISAKDIKAFMLESTRFHRIVDLCILESSENFMLTSTEIAQEYNFLSRSLFSVVPYSEQTDLVLEAALEKLKTTLKSRSTLTAKERREINSAMAASFIGGVSSQGHWFKCANDHIYCITECGGAVETAQCPIKGCLNLIGGTNHAYLPNQRLASEMDGATRPAWSEANNMANFIDFANEF